MSHVMVSAALLVSLALLFLGVRIVERVEADNLILREEEAALRQLRESLDARSAAVRRYRHDAESLLRAMEAGNRTPAVAHAAGALADVPSLSGMPGAPASRFPLAAAALELHVRECARAGIPFSCQVPPDFWERACEAGVDDPDLCLVLQNLLDNAHEACLKVVEAGMAPTMSLEMGALPDGSLRIAVRNSTASATPPDFQTSKEHRELHGVGMEVVREMAKAHGGSVEVDFDRDARILCITVGL